MSGVKSEAFGGWSIAEFDENGIETERGNKRRQMLARSPAPAVRGPLQRAENNGVRRGSTVITIWRWNREESRTRGDVMLKLRVAE